MKVFVVMSNDYPDIVFEDKDDAERYCREKVEAQQTETRGQRVGYGRLIYYKVYDFELTRRQSDVGQ